jgi:hypothetical protein
VGNNLSNSIGNQALAELLERLAIYIRKHPDRVDRMRQYVQGELVDEVDPVWLSPQARKQSVAAESLSLGLSALEWRALTALVSIQSE